MKILTTGIRSGLGRYIHEYMGGVGISRETSDQDWEKIRESGIDIIIHCAFNSRRDINSETLYGYLNDNVLLTRQLVSIPHKKFIFISTADVYPKNGQVHKEDEIIAMENVSGLYGITKLMSESIVKRNRKNYLILRGTGLLGKNTRKNSLMKIIEDKDCRLTLTSSSTVNYVLHKNVLDFIKLAIERDLKGIYNLASAENITLKEVANMLGKKVTFGGFTYDVGNIDNKKITAVLPTFNRTSREIIMEFVGDKS